MRLPHHPQEKAIRNCVGEFFSEFDGPMRLSTVMVSFLSMILIGRYGLLGTDINVVASILHIGNEI